MHFCIGKCPQILYLEKGRMKSLIMFLENYKINIGIKISQAEFDDEFPIMSLPFYAIESFLKQ